MAPPGGEVHLGGNKVREQLACTPTGPFLVFASTRNAQHLQRDVTHQILALNSTASQARFAARQGDALSAKAKHPIVVMPEPITDCPHPWA